MNWEIKFINIFDTVGLGEQLGSPLIQRPFFSEGTMVIYGKNIADAMRNALDQLEKLGHRNTEIISIHTCEDISYSIMCGAFDKEEKENNE